uniref:Protein MTSS 2 isoform X2 n=1 Tax=Petromyzon marinus TaxID=7757 RepID=A0AAJ7X081_PETMA|nr:protein MTSS 2 isoform X2 [Petromyzon marinus]
METVIEKECGALGGLFQAVMNDMKVSYPIWEDFISRASKLHSQLRTTLTAAGAFLEAFQKVADMATNTRGATRDIGSALTRMCMRHRSIETKLAHFTQALASNLLGPLQEKLEEWKKTAAQLDKDHAKEYKKARQEIKKKSTDTIRLQKKAKKETCCREEPRGINKRVEIIGNREVQPALDSALQEVTDTYLLLQEEEKQAVRRALLEERSRYCTFTYMLRDVLTHEVAMLGDVTHLQAILDDLSSLTKDPHALPPASEQLILDLKGSDYNWSYQTPPSSPSTSGSRKSSMCSSLNSVTSSDSRSSGSHAHSPSAHYRTGGLAPPAQAPLRLSSVSSDSGFTSQDTVYSKPPSPMFGQLAQKSMSLAAESSANEGSLPASALPQQLSCHDPPRSSHSACFSFPPLPCDALPVTNHRPTPHPSSPARACHPHNPTANKHPPPRLNDSPPLSPLPLSSQVPSWKDWVKPGPYDLQVANTLARRSEFNERPAPMTTPAEMVAPPAPGVSAGPIMPGPVHKAPGDLARAMLAQSLLSGSQKSSQETLPCSSGYGSQASTPRSDDSISMHGGDYGYYTMNGEMDRAAQSDFDKCATISRSSDIARAYRHMFQNKRGSSVSSAAADSAAAAGLAACGVATIRRTPTLRRTASSGGPIPIQTPMIPLVRGPVVPPVHVGGTTGRGGGGGGRGGREQQHDGGGGLMSPKHGMLPVRASASSRTGSEERIDSGGSPRHVAPPGRSWSRSGSEEALERSLSPKHSTPSGSSSTPGTPGTPGPHSWQGGSGGGSSRSGSEERLEERSLSPRRGSHGPGRGGWSAGPPPTLMKPSAAVIAAVQGGGGGGGGGVGGGLQRAGSQGSYYAQAEEEQRMAQNYQSIAEKLEALTAGAHALAEEQFPPTVPPPGALPSSLPEETDTLGTIRRGVRLRQTGPRSDRSAPMFAYYALLQGEKRIK